MRKIIALIFLTTISLSAQKKEVGKVFSEHPLISVSEDFWRAYQQNDESKIKAMTAENFIYVRNDNNLGQGSLTAYLGEANWASNRFENLEVKNANGWVSDAIKYEDGNTWILSWKRWKGTDKNTGIRMNSFLHMQMRINKDKKIDYLNVYNNQSDFTQMFESEGTRESGVVFEAHPAIVQVRKVVAHYLNQEFDQTKSYFDSNATFWNSTLNNWENSITLEQRVESWKNDFDTYSEIYMNEQGKPIAIQYEGSDMIYVNSWWTLYGKKGEDWFAVPFKSTHAVNSDNKIVSESIFFSSNRFEEKVN